MIPKGQGNRLLSVEAARGLAAVLVAIVHASDITATPRYYGSVPFDGLTRNFGAGVDFFFVLSGFIIMFVHSSDIGHRDRLANYFRRRFLRIYPLYWSILLPLVVIYQLFPSFGIESQHQISTIVLSFFLLPGPHQPVLGVAWTLVFEVTFYCAFGFMIFFGRSILPLAFLWAAAIVVVGIAVRPAAFPAAFFLNPRILEFGLGACVAQFVATRRVPIPSLLLICGACSFLLGLLVLHPTLEWADLAFTGVFGCASAAMILGLVELERSGRIPRLKLFAEMGACSYAIYLAHVVVESFMERPAMLFRHIVPLDIMTLLIAAAGVAGGILVHYFLEQPVNAFAHRLYPARRSPSAALERAH